MNSLLIQKTPENISKDSVATNTVNKSLWGGTERFDQLLADIRDRRSDYEKQRYIPQDIIERFKEAGLYRALVPEQFGGGGKTPAEFLLAIEAIAAADGSAGWVASFGMSPAYLAGLPMSTLEKIWGETPDVVFAGAAFPPQDVVVVDGGFRVSGRWPYLSGCMGASLIGVSVKIPGAGPLPRMAVLPVESVSIDQSTWGVQGMASSGSFDGVVDDVFVASDWVFERGGTPTIETDFLRYPSLSFAAQVLSVTAAGIAREAIDIVLSMAERSSITGAPSIGDRNTTQVAIAKAEAKLRGARAFFYEATHDAWNAVITEGKPSRHQTNMLRLATSNLTHECAEVVAIAYRLGGMSSAYYQSHMSRCFRDVHMPTQHALMGDLTFQNAGTMLFNKEPSPGYL